jgi:hypothetical protein
LARKSARCATRFAWRAVAFRFRQRTRNAEVDEASFFAAGNDVDRESERGLGLLQELGRILGNAQGIGADRADRLARQSAQPLAKALQTG